MDHFGINVAVALPWLENVIIYVHVRQEHFQTTEASSSVHCIVSTGSGTKHNEEEREKGVRVRRRIPGGCLGAKK